MSAERYLICPVCGESLKHSGAAFSCCNRHSFDVSSAGYVNLFVTNKSKAPGDNRDMIEARHLFLESGGYAPLRDFLSELIRSTALHRSNEPPVLVDAGCGEGYYTAGVCEKLAQNGVYPDAIGFDISKPAIKTAARRKSPVCFAVASAFSMPVRKDCADVLLSIFAPLCADEFRRILKPDGCLIIAAPGRRHLLGLKEVLYEHPYENEENRFAFEGLHCVGVYPASYEMQLENPQDIRNLFAMTPYYWKTPSEGMDRLKTLQKLSTPVEFEFHLFRK